MKYANLYWQNTELADGEVKAVNMGDLLQFLTIDFLYSKMNIKKEEIVHLQMSELCDYEGEYLVLPLNWALFDKYYMKEEKMAISPYIIPVFLAVTIESVMYKEEYFNEYNINYLKRYEPIGCRDEYTLKQLQRYGIKAYLNGCLTAVLDKRIVYSKPDKVFLIDMPIELENYMPDSLNENIEYLSQQKYFASQQPIPDILEVVKEHYRRIEKEARLVITSRLHVASPCMAMGIPVILVKEKIDYRFSWIDKLLPLYGKGEWDSIDWNPKAVEYEDVKARIVNNALNRISGTYEDNKDAFGISEFYELRKKKVYRRFQEVLQNNIDKIYDFLAERYKKEDEFCYSVWGIGAAAENLYKFMVSEYPNAKLRCAVDMYRKTEFHGVETIDPEAYTMEENEVMLVVAVKASNMAKEKFSALGIPQDKYICAGDLFLNK